MLDDMNEHHMRLYTHGVRYMDDAMCVCVWVLRFTNSRVRCVNMSTAVVTATRKQTLHRGALNDTHQTGSHTQCG